MYENLFGATPPGDTGALHIAADMRVFIEWQMEIYANQMGLDPKAEIESFRRKAAGQRKRIETIAQKRKNTAHSKENPSLN